MASQVERDLRDISCIVRDVGVMVQAQVCVGACVWVGVWVWRPVGKALNALNVSVPK